MGRMRDKLHRRIFSPRLAAFLVGLCLIAAAPGGGFASVEQMTREQAMESIAGPDLDLRRNAVRRLAEIGGMSDVDALVDRLRDSDPLVRALASDAMWRIWGRSGDEEIDALYLRGIGEMRDGHLADALQTFNRIIQRKPDFAEGWNKRATIRFLVGDYENSLADCDEVFKRNPQHFGALAGAGQIHLMLDHLEIALDFFTRALAVNPNLEGPAMLKSMIEQHLREKTQQQRGQPV